MAIILHTNFFILWLILILSYLNLTTGKLGMTLLAVEAAILAAASKDNNNKLKEEAAAFLVVSLEAGVQCLRTSPTLQRCIGVRLENLNNGQVWKNKKEH